jgi:uncharacterized protein
MQEQIKRFEEKVKELMFGEATGHDWYHVKQVRDMALRIADTEGGDRELIELAALAHDIGDRKFSSSEEEGEQKTLGLLKESGISGDILCRVMNIIQRLSFKGADIVEDMPTLEGKIVQDADRLYGLGAVGVARTFAYGGAKGRPIYDPEVPVQKYASKDAYYSSKSSTINHFYEKMLLVKDRINTKTAQKIAERRHAFLEEFLEHFYAEWEAKD